MQTLELIPKTKAERSKIRREELKQLGRCLSCGQLGLSPTSKCLCSKCCAKDSIRKTRKRHSLEVQAYEYCNSKCFDCDYHTRYLAVYDFHHLRDKKYELNDMFKRSRPWSIIKEELDKCVMLCANCHRIRHAEQSERYK